MQKPDGKWLPSDEEGNLLDPPVESRDSLKAEGNDPVKGPPSRSRRRPSSSLRRDSKNLNTCLSVLVSEDVSKQINRYVGWKSMLLGYIVSRSEVMANAVMVFIEKDSDYRKYLRQLAGGQKKED